MTYPTYEVRLTTPVPEHLFADLGVMTQIEEPAQTVVYTTAGDQAALLGLLDRIRALGLEVIEVRRVPNAGCPTDVI